MDKVRVGFIGCGGIAQYHFGHFEKMADKAQITACCDLLPERTQATADRFGCRQYQDYREMFKNEELDACFICVEPSAHDGMEFIAIDKGIPIFVQKPMSLDMKYAKKVLAAIRKKKLISAVGLQCRYAETLPMVQKWVASKKIGVFNANRIGGFPMVRWWRNRALSGGQPVEQTIHDFDLCRCLFGDVERVSSVARFGGLMSHIEGNTMEDATSTIITFKNGIIGTFNTGCFGAEVHNLTAYGANGCSVDYKINGTYKITEPNLTIEGTAGNDFGQECDETFIDAVRGDIDADEILTPYSEAIKSLAFVFAINESIENMGMPVAPVL